MGVNRSMADVAIQAVRNGGSGRLMLRAFIILVVAIPGFFISLHASFFVVSGLFEDPSSATVPLRVIITAGCALGLFCAGALIVRARALMGGALSSGVQRLVSPKTRAERSIRVETPRSATRSLWGIGAQMRENISSRLSFLEFHREDLHSILVIGSAAHGLESEDSDIDVVIICRERGYDAVRDVVCEREIAQSGQLEPQKIEYTVLSPAETEELFRMASPFAHAILRGTALIDDGYWAKLKKRGCEVRPARPYVMKSMRETVIVQYFGAIRTLQGAIKENACSDVCCTERRGCPGITAGNVLARVIMRMLYITLPSRGYIPVTKADIIHFASEVYGETSLGTLERVVSTLRREEQPFLYRDYVMMKPLATRLFRETLSVANFGADVSAALKNVTSLMRGDYGRIKDRALRACVVKESSN